MAEVAEVVNDVQPVEKEPVEKKTIVEVDEGKTEKKEKDTNPKENGRAETNEKETETNGSEYQAAKGKKGTRGVEDQVFQEIEKQFQIEIIEGAETKEVTATKRKSGAGDAPDGTPAEGATPEKKAKISNEEKEKDSTNGESEVASEGATVTPNSRSYQKH